MRHTDRDPISDVDDARQLSRLDDALARLAAADRAPSGLTGRVFEASAEHLPAAAEQVAVIATVGGTTAGGWSPRALSRLAMAAAIGLAFVLTAPVLRQLDTGSGVVDGGGDLAPVALQSGASPAEPVLATLLHERCCREQRTGPDGAPVAAWLDLVDMSDADVAPMLQVRGADIDDFASELDHILHSTDR